MGTLDAKAVTRLVSDLARAELGDARRTARAQMIVERVAAAPGVTLPQALVTEAELEGAYRFINNDGVCFDDLLASHVAGVRDRARGADIVLAIHDTTNCQCPHADPEEVGYLATGKPGFLLHASLVVDTRDWRRPLGIVHAEPLKRATRRTRRGARRKVNVPGSETARWKNKESDRWLRGVHRTEEQLSSITEVLHVADRESDSYALMAPMIAAGQRFVFRARHDRVVDDDGDGARMSDLVERADVVLEREVPLSQRLAKTAPRHQAAYPQREARTATLHFATTKATIRGPRYCDDMPETIDINVVHVFEHLPPEGQEPVEWLLYTTEPIGTRAQLEFVVDTYRCRWLIEELNKALKTGCVVQERQFESYHAFLNLLALSLPIAVELLAVRSLARMDPPRPATDVLSKGQLEALRHLSHRPVPRRPTAQDVLWCIAGIGGHIKNNGQPGWQVLQRGMEKFAAFAEGWCAREAEM
jgi:hypothetical protein